MEKHKTTRNNAERDKKRLQKDTKKDFTERHKVNESLQIDLK